LTLAPSEGSPGRPRVLIGCDPADLWELAGRRSYPAAVPNRERWVTLRALPYARARRDSRENWRVHRAWQRDHSASHAVACGSRSPVDRLENAYWSCVNPHLQ